MTLTTETPAASTATRAGARWFQSLSFRLFAITVAAILFVEALIFVPSAANFRNDWINNKLEAARVASLALEAAPMRRVSESLSDKLAMEAGVIAVTEIEDEIRTRLVAEETIVDGDIKVIDVMNSTAMERGMGALAALFAPDDRLLVLRDYGSEDGAKTIEVLVKQEPLRAELRGFARRVFYISLLIALVAATLIFFLLHKLVVEPMQRVTRSLERFRDDPASAARRVKATTRTDEIGRAQNALIDMEQTVATSFRQKQRLAELGEAVAKINHDLRNSLSSAQLVSDTLARSEDPRVKRAAPRLERALERAIKLATETLEYGKARPMSINLDAVNLSAALDDAAAEALANANHIAWENDISPQQFVETDVDNFHRILVNLVRNAAEAMADQETGAKISVSFEDARVIIADNGPGLPDRAKENLFKPFAGSTKAAGSGLGLAIAKELAQAMQSTVKLERTGAEGTTFSVSVHPVEAP